MQFGVFGTGMVGQALASKLVSLGDRVMMGARNSDNEKAVAWTRAMGALARWYSTPPLVLFRLRS
ncbi:MAG: NAD(P)-binding domain-containing protein [Ktedonobacteraceae bacterium]|nr:NAD(P)-binding domain-containing protein [Ktedonobacteraceae bacterium]